MNRHHPEGTPLGRAFLVGGVVVGMLVIFGLYAKSIGLFGGGEQKTADVQPFTRQGERIIVPKESPLRARLAVAPAETRHLSGKRALPGIVESDPARTVSILPPLSGRVAELRVGLGERVKSGQLLSVIDSPDLAQALDDDDKAADSLKLAERALKREQDQFDIGTASAQELDQARSNEVQARAELARTQARLRVVGVAPGGTRAKRLEIRSPVAGSVTSLNVAVGGMINDPNQPIMTVADLSTVWVTAMVPEKDLAQVFKDQDAEVSLDAYPGLVLHGKVLFISDVLEPDSRRDKVRIAFTNPDVALKPNMFATVTLRGPEKQQVVLPTSALLMNNDRTTIFVETGDWSFERRIVTPDLEVGSEVAIGTGIAPGEQVVIKGGILLND